MFTYFFFKSVRNRNKKDLDANPAVSSSRNSLYTVGSSKSFTPPQSGPQAAEYNSKVTSGVNCAFKNAAGFGTRTIKAATRYIDAQGKRAASLTKQQKSLSMVDLASSPPSHTLVQPPLHLIDTETSGQPDLDRQLSPTTLSTTTAIQSENSGGNNIDKNDTNATGASSTNLQMNAQRHSAHNRNETPIELSANPKWNSNHATGAIRSIIESQYAVLQQETNQPRHGPEVRRKKKQNKLRVNFVNSSNGTFADHGVTLKPKDFSRNTLLPDFGGCAPPITCSVSDSMFDLTKECIQDSVHEPNEASSLFVKHYLPADLSGESMVDNRSLQSLPNRTQNPSNTEVNSVRNEQTMTDNVMSTASPSDDPVPKDPMLAQLRALREQAQKPTKSQQFSCLPARSSPYAGNEGPLRNADLSHSHTVRSLSLQAPDCPLNRLQFYKTFAQLVRRGRRGLHSASALTNQQMGGFFELVYKQELRDLIWLEIKAWLVDRSMIEQDRHLCQQRKNIPDTLNKVMRFTIQPSHVDNERAERIEKIERIEQKIDKLDKFDKLEKVMMQYAGPDDNIGASLSSTTALDSQPGNLKTLIDQDLLAASVAVKLSISEQQPNTDLHRVKEDARRNASDTSDSPNPDDENCACSETLSRLCKFCVDKETSAFEQVNKMLAEIDEIEQLYPCVKALAIDYPLYSSDEFTARIKSLYLYQNIIRDLREKINLLAKLFHITNREAAGWPNFRDSGSLMDFPVNTSSDCTPEVIGNSNSVNTSTTTTINSAPGSASDPKYGYSYKLNAPVINSASSKHVHFRCDANSSVIDSSRCNSIIDLNSPDSIGSSNILLLNTNSNIDFKSKDSNTATSISSEQSIKPENPFFQCKPSVYRRYVDKSLKHKGLRYIYHQLSHILRPLLYRVHAALKKPTTSGIHGQLDGAPSASPSALHHFMMSSVGAETSNIGGSSSSGNNCGHCNMNNTSGCNNSVVNNTGNVNNSASNNSQPSSQSNQCNCLTTSQASVDLLMKSSNMIMAGRQSEASIEELSQFGVWSNAYQQMGLPTFHRPFLFLLRVTVDVVHECLILRLEQQPEQPSNVSVGQLIRECKEVIKASVQIKQHYINLAQIVLGEAGTELFEAQLDSFNDDMKTMLSIYLRYLESYMLCMQSVTSKRVSTLRQKGYLEEEWNFVRYYCPHIPGGEALAANKFCVLASDLLTSIGDYIRNGVADCFVQVDHALESLPTDPALFRKSLLGACRSFKLVFQEANAKACQATAFAKSLRKHLEIAAEYRISTSGGQLLERLRQTEHVRVIAPNCASHLLFVPAHMQTKVGALWQLLDMTCGGRCSVDPEEVGEPFAGYLLITNLTPALESAWSGSCVYLEPTIETTLSLSYVEANGVLFLVCDPAQLTARCRQFAAQMHEHVHVLTHQTSCNQAIADALTALKHQALSIQENTADSLKAIYKRLDLSPCHEIDEPERNILQMRCLDVLHQGFKFAFEYEKALTRLITGKLISFNFERFFCFRSQLFNFNQQVICEPNWLIN